MHPSILATRKAEARARVDSALAALAERTDVADLTTAPAPARDRDVRELREIEAWADRTEALVQAFDEPEEGISTAANTSAILDAIAEVDGVGAKTMEAIRDHLTEQGMI